MITFHEREREFLWQVLNTIWQDYNQRTLYGETVIQSLMVKLKLVTVTFTEQESRLLQFLIHDKEEVLARLTDQRLQHILQSQNTQGFGAPGETGAPPGSTNTVKAGNCGSGFFHSGQQYWLCKAIMEKLLGS